MGLFHEVRSEYSPTSLFTKNDSFPSELVRAEYSPTALFSNALNLMPSNLVTGYRIH